MPDLCDPDRRIRVHDGKPTYQAGIVTGIFVPLLDFN
jgi:hypothetical protein